MLEFVFVFLCSQPPSVSVVRICVNRRAPPDQRRGRGASSKWAVVPTDRRLFESAGRFLPWNCTTCSGPMGRQVPLHGNWPVRNGWILSSSAVLELFVLEHDCKSWPHRLFLAGRLRLQSPQRLALGPRGDRTRHKSWERWDQAQTGPVSSRGDSTGSAHTGSASHSHTGSAHTGSASHR